MKYLALVIPVIFAVFASAGCGFFFRAGVPVSCAAILLLMPGRVAGRSIRWVIAALLVSIVADWFMMRSNSIQSYFLYGICLFFLVHLGFLIFCLKNGRIDQWLLLTVLTGYLAFYFVVLRPAITHPALLVAVLAYLLVSCLSLAAAAGLRLPSVAHWCFTAGIALLVFSDTIIALKVFAGYGGLNFLILPAYFASHIMITKSFVSEE